MQHKACIDQLASRVEDLSDDLDEVGVLLIDVHFDELDDRVKALEDRLKAAEGHLCNCQATSPPLSTTMETVPEETEADRERAVPRLSGGGIIALQRTLVKLQALYDAYPA